jgi:cobalt-zinc-cadmium efflux system outer membrane protein
MTVKVLLAFSGVLLAAAAQAANPESTPIAMTYEEMLKRLGSSNPRIRAMDCAAKAVREKALQEGAYPNPDLAYTQGCLKEGEATGRSMEWAVSQEVDYSLRWISRRGAARSEAEARIAGLREERIAFKRRVVGLYYSLQSLAVERNVVEAKRRGALALLARVEQDQTVGSAKPGEWRRAQAASRIAEVEYLETVRRAQAESRRLGILLGFPAGTRVVPKGTLTYRARKPKTEGILQTVLRNNPRVVQMRMELKAARARKSLALKETFPTLSVEGSRESGDEFEEKRLGLSMSVPLWDRKGAARQGAGHEVEALELRLKNLEAETAVDVQIALDDLEAAQRKVAALQPGLIESDELLWGAETRFAEGKMPLTAFLDALSAAYEIKRQYLLSLLDHENALMGFADLTGDDAYYEDFGGQ